MDRRATPAAGSPPRNRIGNALLYAVCADRIAAPLLGNRLPSTAQIDAAMHPRPSHLPAGSHLGEHLLLLAEHLAQRAGELDGDILARTLARHPPPAGATGGAGTAKVLSLVAQGTPWWQAAATVHDGQGSHGSTAAVRSVAVGLLPHQGLGAIAETARRAAVITHTHPWAHDAAAVIACAVALASHGLPGGAISTGRFLAIITSHARDPGFRHHLSAVRTLVRHRAGPAETIGTLGGGSVVRTVPAALTAFLRHPADPLAALRFALTLGGHTCAIAGITAALAGARCPESPPPSAWRLHTDSLRVHAAATALAELKPVNPQAWRSL